MAIVPLLLSVACAVSHVAPGTPVIAQGWRTITARALSHSVVLIVSIAILVGGEALSTPATLGPSLRNLFVFTSLALLTASLAGASYAWVPVVGLFGAGVLSSPDASQWSLFGLVMAPSATGQQLALTGGACAIVVGIAALDPLNRAYLPRAQPRR